MVGRRTGLRIQFWFFLTRTMYNRWLGYGLVIRDDVLPMYWVRTAQISAAYSQVDSTVARRMQKPKKRISFPKLWASGWKLTSGCWGMQISWLMRMVMKENGDNTINVITTINFYVTSNKRHLFGMLLGIGLANGKTTLSCGKTKSTKNRLF